MKRLTLPAPAGPVRWTLLLAAALALAACGGSKSAGAGTPAQPAAHTATSGNAGGAAAASPVPPDLSRFVAFNSPGKGYSVSYPAGWEVKQDAYGSANFSADQFNPPSQALPNVSILCKRLSPGQTADAFLQQNIGLLRTEWGASVTDPLPLTVAGQDASLILYDSSQTGQSAAVLFVRSGCGWIITLAAPAGQRDAYMPAFRQMLASLALR